MFRPPVILLAWFALLPGAWAQFEAPANTPTTQATLVCEAKTIAPATPFSIALQLRHPAGWHSYYQNSGGVEQSPALTWTLPEGFTAGPIQWPVPKVKDGFGKSFVYADTPVLLVDILPPATLQPGTTVTLTAAASWQICSESGCINENHTFTLKLPTGPAMEKDAAAAELFAKARASRPAKPANWKISAQAAAGGDILLRVQPDGALENDPTDFIPDQPFVKPVSSGSSIKRDGKAWLIHLKRATEDAIKQPIPQGSSLSGILIGLRPIAIPDTAIATVAASANPPPAPLPLAGLLPVLGGMLLGGLILNLMPCVFPVLGLKIMGFVQQAGANRKKIALHGLIFTLGVLVSFGVLSGILFVARVGWGFQLQNPWVVCALLLLMFVLALNMFGLFELGTSATSVGGSLQAKHGLSGSFFSGVLATVVATPCSGPFLGAAIGAAITLPALQFFTAFAAMAVGLALPYLILSVFPGLLGFLPRPGAWMESFKQAMSFLLFATAGYLLWVYAGQIGLDNLLDPIFGLGAIAGAAWIDGRWNLPHRTRRTRLTALALAILLAAAGVFLAKPPRPSTLIWEPWSAERVAALLDDNTPVYIDFTAQWCATCQLNKMRAYTPEVVALMKAKHVATLKADKTKPSPQIEQALQQLGRTAIPVNVLLAPGRDSVILPPLLAPADLLEALRKL